MLYDPEEFWAEVRATVREELARAPAQSGALQSALGHPGLTLKPAYTMSETELLFQVSRETLDEWTQGGLLRTIRIGRQLYILYADLGPLFK
jgi:hypothetical protein